MTTIQTTTQTTTNGSAMDQLKQEINGGFIATISDWTWGPIASFFRNSKMDDAYAVQKSKNQAMKEDGAMIAFNQTYGSNRGQLKFEKDLAADLAAEAKKAEEAAKLAAEVEKQRLINLEKNPN